MTCPRNFSAITAAARKLQDVATTRVAPHEAECDASVDSFSRIIGVQEFIEHLGDLQREKFQNFVQAVSESLGLQVEEVSLTKAWQQEPPQEAQGAGLQDYMSSVITMTPNDQRLADSIACQPHFQPRLLRGIRNVPRRLSVAAWRGAFPRGGIPSTPRLWEYSI